VPHCKLTQKTVDKLPAQPPHGKRVIHWDTDLRGFGCLCGRSKSYVVQRDLPGGRTRRVTIAAVNELTLSEAKDRARRVLLDLREGKDPKARGRGLTLQQTLDAYFAANKTLKPRTREIYTELVRLHLAPWRDRPLASITVSDADALHRTIAAKVAKRGRGHNGHSVANDTMRLLRLLYNWAAQRNETLTRNPVRLRKSEWHLVSPELRRRPIPPDRLRDFYEAVMKLPDTGRTYFMLLLFTGLRRRSVAALRWDQVDFDQRVLRLPAENMKAGRPFDLPMNDVVHALLVARRTQLNNVGYVFPSYGRQRHIEDPRAWQDAVIKATGLKFSMHDLRRTFASICARCDLSEYAIKALVHHSVGSGVTDIYVKLDIAYLRVRSQRVADELKTLCGVAAIAGGNVAVLR
jgi:integrase